MKKIGSALLVAILMLAAFSVNCFAYGSIPGDVEITSMTNTENGIVINWDYDYNTSKYWLYRKTADSDWTVISKSSSTSYTDANVQSGVVYSYSVQGVSYYGDQGPFDDIGQSIMYIPSVNVTLKTLADGVQLKWTAVSGCEGYRIYRGDGYDFSLVTTVASNVTSYTDKKAVNGDDNYYKVVAYFGGYEGASSSKGTSVYYLKAPKITSIKNKDGQILLKWAENTEAYEYIVYRKKVGSRFKQIDTTYSNQYYDSTAKSGVKYIYAVQASDGTDKKSRTTQSKQILFLAQTKVTLSNSNGGVKVKWTKVAGTSGYKIYRKLGNNSYKLVKTVSASTKSYVDKKAASGKTYKYVVKAYKSGVTVGSAETSIRYLAAPVIKTGKATSNGAKLTWKKVPGAKGYKVYEKGSNGYYFITTVTKTTFTDVTINKGQSKRYKVCAYNGENESAMSAAKLVKQNVKNKQIPTRAEMAAHALILLEGKLKNPSTLVVNNVYYRGSYVYIWYSAANGYGNMVDGWVRCYHSADRGLFEYSIKYKSGYILTELDAIRPSSWDGTVSWKSIEKAYDNLDTINYYYPQYY